MCNQSVGLLQREVERSGIPTVGISISRSITEKVKPPRSIFLRWPFGHPLGEPFNGAQQRAVLTRALDAFEDIRVPGGIIDVPFAWRRQRYE